MEKKSRFSHTFSHIHRHTHTFPHYQHPPHTHKYFCLLQYTSINQQAIALQWVGSSLEWGIPFIYCWGQIQRHVTAVAAPCQEVLLPSTTFCPAAHTAPWHPLTSFPPRFSFSRTFYSWNQIEYNLFRLTSFTN